MSFLKPKENSNTIPSFFVSTEDIFSDIAGKKGSTLLLGKYTLQEAAIVLKRRGFIKAAKKRKLWPIHTEVDSSQFPPLQRLRMFYKDNDPDNMLVDLKIREGNFKPGTDLPAALAAKNYRFLVMEWLTLQNPLKRFSPERTPLPGQKYPGLNLGRKIVDLFIYIARLNKNDGILAYPAFYHNSILFSRNFFFLNPEKNAEVQKIRKSFPNITFKQLAWIVHLNCLRDRERKVYEWKAEEQILPINKDLNSYFYSQQYQSEVAKAENDLNFSVDWICYWDKIKQQPKM